MDHWGITVNILLKLVHSFSPMHCWFVLSTITIAWHGARPFKGHTSAQRQLTSWYRSDKLSPQRRTSAIPCPAELYLLQFPRRGALLFGLCVHFIFIGAHEQKLAGMDVRGSAGMICSGLQQRLIFQQDFTLREIQVIHGREFRCRAGSSWAHGVSLGQTLLILKAKTCNRKMTEVSKGVR